LQSTPPGAVAWLSEDVVDLECRWYAVQVRPKSERCTSQFLHAKGYDPFLPLYPCRRRWSDRIKELHLPLIPNYLFCRVTSEAIGAIVTTPGVIRIVGAGRTPIAIDDHEISALQRIDALRLSARPWPFLREGQTVQVTDGPLAGTRGVLLRVKSAQRLVVSVSLLQRSVAVELDANSVFADVGALVA
jgi:transcription antitermination factor NusG